MTDEIFMREALKEAKKAKEEDEVPIGAIIIHDNQVIARAHNQVEMLKDPTAHAEMIAITQATNFLSQKWLMNCTMYVTLEPCSMCAGALVLSRISRLCIGALDPKTGACGSVFNIVQNSNLNHSIDLTTGICQPECSDLLSKFFQSKRIRST